jgi:hypothetical protein
MKKISAVAKYPINKENNVMQLNQVNFELLCGN